jgi:hypothetical protein
MKITVNGNAVYIAEGGNYKLIGGKLERDNIPLERCDRCQWQTESGICSYAAGHRGKPIYEGCRNAVE